MEHFINYIRILPFRVWKVPCATCTWQQQFNAHVKHTQMHRTEYTSSTYVVPSFLCPTHSPYRPHDVSALRCIWACTLLNHMAVWSWVWEHVHMRFREAGHSNSRFLSKKLFPSGLPTCSRATRRSKHKPNDNRPPGLLDWRQLYPWSIYLLQNSVFSD